MDMISYLPGSQTRSSTVSLLPSISPKTPLQVLFQTLKQLGHGDCGFDQTL